MRRAFPFLIIACIVAGLALWFWNSRHHQQGRPASPAFVAPLQSVLTNAVQSAKNHITGGVGVILRMDPASGLPIVQGVGVGSPAEAAGLHVGDLITQLNGMATAGQPLRQIVETFRGFTLASVSVTVRRAGITNLTFVIGRTSWNSLLKTTYNQVPSTNY